MAHSSVPFRRLLPLLLGLAIAVGASTVMSQPAYASSTYYVANTGGEGLYLHPDSPSLSSTVSPNLMADGTAFDIDCFAVGDDVYGDVIWHYGTNQTTGETGYASDYYIDTPVTVGQEADQLRALGIPECGQEDTGTSQPTTDSSGWVPYCGPSTYFDDITVVRYATGEFIIQPRPNAAARTALDANAATIDEWHAIQACVSGLYGPTADSIWEQLKCHQFMALVPNSDFQFATGDTYGLDSWRPVIADDWGTWIDTGCGNSVGTEPEGEPVYEGRPDDGVTDFDYGSIG